MDCLGIITICESGGGGGGPLGFILSFLTILFLSSAGNSDLNNVFDFILLISLLSCGSLLPKRFTTVVLHSLAEKCSRTLSIFLHKSN